MKRRAWMVGVIVFGALGGGLWLLGPGFWARSWESKWRDFRSEWEANGEDFGVEAHLAPEIPEEENFARHPWILKLAAEDPAVLERIEAMSGPVDEEMAALLDSRGEFDEFVKRVMSEPELRDRLRSHFSEYQAELGAFSEAVARPGMAADLDLEGGLAEMKAPWMEWIEVSKVVRWRAMFALASGDTAGMASDAETLIRLGNHLRHERFLMGFVVGNGADAVADKIINEALDLGVLGKEERSRLARALEVDRPSVEEALTAMLRFERGMWLREVDRMEAGVAEAVQMPSRGFPNRMLPQEAWMRGFFARNRLALCEDLQQQLLAVDGGVRKVLRVEDLPAFEEALEARFAEDNAEEVIAAMAIPGVTTILRHMQRVEDKRLETLGRLRSGR